MKGKAIIFSAPSGAGKTTLVKHVLNADLNLAFSISACSRPKREWEQNEKDYYFISEKTFKQKIKNNEFLEWEEVYNGNYYGTLKSEVKRVWEEGKHLIFDVDVIGGLALKDYFKDDALAIFVEPPSIKVLEERLMARKSETSETLAKRIAKAEFEMQYANRFDKIIVNDNLEIAKTKAIELITRFLTA